MADEPVVAALVEAARGLGRCEAAVDGLRADFGELHNFVNEHLQVNYQDVCKRLEQLETVATARRASWKTITVIATGIAGSSGLIAAAIDWVRTHHH